MIDVILIFMGSIAATWIGSLEYRIRTMQSNMQNMLPKEDVNDLIDLKQAVLTSQQADLKEDLSRLEVKIDKLIDLYMSKN